MHNQHSIISESLQFCLQTRKSLKFHRFESAQNFKLFFFRFEICFFCLFLIFSTEDGVDLNLYLNEPRVRKELFF